MSQVHLPPDQVIELRQRALEDGVAVEVLISQAIAAYLDASWRAPKAGRAEVLVRKLRGMQPRLDAAIMKISVAPGAAQKELTGVANELSDYLEDATKED